MIQLAETVRGGLLKAALAGSLLATSAWAQTPSPNAPETMGPPVVVIPIEGGLSETHVALMLRGYSIAEASSAAAIILRIDTTGGEITLMDRIIDQIEDHPAIPTAAYITDRAASAGSLVAISCNRIFMRPGAHLGSSKPILLLPFDLLPGEVGDQPREYLEKMQSELRGHFRAKAQRTGRNPAIAEAMVDQKIVVYEIEIDGLRDYVSEKEYREKIEMHGPERVHRIREICSVNELLNLTATEAYELQFIDGLVEDQAGVLRLMGFENAPVIELVPSWSERLAELIQRFWWLFLVGGLLFGFIELKIPGFGIPGILGLLCFALLLFGKYLVGLAEVTEVLLIVIGLALIAVELFVFPGTLVAGILGAISVLTGLILSFQSFVLPSENAPPWAVDDWWVTLTNLGYAFLAGIVSMYLLTHFLPHLPILRGIALRSSTGGSLQGSGTLMDDVHRDWRPAVGATGLSESPLRPVGKINLGGHRVDAVAEGKFVDAGISVKVIRVEGNRIVVRPLNPA